jgi:hypothetical protein
MDLTRLMFPHEEADKECRYAIGSRRECAIKQLACRVDVGTALMASRRRLRAAASCHPNQDADAERDCDSHKRAFDQEEHVWAMDGVRHTRLKALYPC